MEQELMIISICVISHIIALLFGCWLGRKSTLPVLNVHKKTQTEQVPFRDIYKEEALDLD